MNVPEDLKQYRQFIVWRLVDRKDGKKPTKLPIGSVSDPSSWVTYDDARLLCESDPSLTGVGFVFTDNDPFVFLDVDACASQDGQWHSDAIQLVQTIAGASWEVSQSGTGLHAIARGDKSILSRKKNRFRTAGGVSCEFYVTGRFMAIGRGDWTLPVPLDATKSLMEFVPDREEHQTVVAPPGPRPGYSGPTSDDELIRKASQSAGSAAQAFGSRASFQQLWTGDTQALTDCYPDADGEGYDASQADAALMERLAFWTGYDEPRMVRLFSRSALGQREKWKNRPDYQTRTVKSITGRQDPRYIGSDRHDTAVRARVAIQTGELWSPPAVSPDKNDHNYMMRVLYEMGVKLSYDEFSERILLDGQPIKESDYLKLYLNSCTAAQMSFPKQKVYDAIVFMAYQTTFNSVKDYLESVGSQWDNIPRIDRWLTVYAGSPDTPYTRAVASKFLIGAVRRIYEPGCKHDEMIVLEGAQGSGKSSLLAALCHNPTWFTDAVTLNMESKNLIEVTQGRWIVEAPELSRLTGSEVEHVKALLSRREDIARLAYGRDTTAKQRQFIFAGTTNAEQYLQDLTGNRRFLPVKTGTLDIDGLTAMRDQIFAEAVTRFKAGESNALPPEIFDDAKQQQAQRVFDNEYLDVLEGILNRKEGLVSFRAVMTVLDIPTHRKRYARGQVTAAMESLGWIKEDRSFRKGTSGRRWSALGSTLVEEKPEMRVIGDVR